MLFCRTKQIPDIHVKDDCHLTESIKIRLYNNTRNNALSDLAIKGLLADAKHRIGFGNGDVLLVFGNRFGYNIQTLISFLFIFSAFKCNFRTSW